MSDKSRKNALVLSGGGGRGAYHVGVLKFLEEHEWYPHIVAGTSIGAVNGAAIASGHNANSLWALWRRLQTDDVQKAGLGALTGNYLLDTAPLRKTLQEKGWVNFDRLNSDKAAVHLRVTATEISTGQLHVFGNSPDVYPSKMQKEPIGLDHIIASCSIPIVYPATQLNDSLYWDGATVANTPLGPAIDAGAEEIVVVMMTPWETEEEQKLENPSNFFEKVSTVLDWALLASFRSDLRMFHRINELVRLQVENGRLRAQNALLLSQIRGENLDLRDEDGNGIPDIFENKFHELPEPIIVAPKEVIPVERILRYTQEGHETLYRMGYEDAKRAWRAAGKEVEGEG
ncbi:MAG TPA: patatin-like phospholipase family protein [Chloroflexota bacterium]|nr:patatin-like phospholipase family protein [Chloroflexota bacterium]